MKLSIIADIANYTILACKSRKKTRHDIIDAKHLVKKLSKHYNPDLFYGDRGYDADELFQIVFEELGAYPLILQKRLDVPKHRRKGVYRKRAFSVFDYGEYLQRNKIETVFSMFKRKFGFSIRSRNHKLQLVETTSRIIAYNIDRLIESGKIIMQIITLRILRVSY